MIVDVVLFRLLGLAFGVRLRDRGRIPLLHPTVRRSASVESDLRVS